MPTSLGTTITDWTDREEAREYARIISHRQHQGSDVEPHSIPDICYTEDGLHGLTEVDDGYNAYWRFEALLDGDVCLEDCDVHGRSGERGGGEVYCSG